MKQQPLVTWQLPASAFSLANNGLGGLSATGPQLQKGAGLDIPRKTGAATFVVEKMECTQPRISGYVSVPDR